MATLGHLGEKRARLLHGPSRDVVFGLGINEQLLLWGSLTSEHRQVKQSLLTPAHKNLQPQEGTEGVSTAQA